MLRHYLRDLFDKGQNTAGTMLTSLNCQQFGQFLGLFHLAV